MASTMVARGDDRVAAILEDPRGYFAAATARAEILASAEVEVELAARARHRRRGGRTRSAHWLGVLRAG